MLSYIVKLPPLGQYYGLWFVILMLLQVLSYIELLIIGMHEMIVLLATSSDEHHNSLKKY